MALFRNVEHRAGSGFGPFFGFAGRSGRNNSWVTACRILGFGFLQAWTLLLFSSPLFFGEVGLQGVSLLHCLSSLVAVVSSVAVLLATPRLLPLSRRRELGLVFAFLCVAGGALLLYGDVVSGNMASSAFGQGIASAGTTWLVLAWQEHLAAYGARDAMVSIIASMLVAGAACAVCVVLPYAPSVVTAMLLPLMSWALLRPCPGARFYATSAEKMNAKDLCSEIAHDISPRFMLVCFLVSAVAGFVQTSALVSFFRPFGAPWIVGVLSFAVAAMLACVIALASKKRSVAFAFCIALGMATAGVVLGQGAQGALLDLARCLVCGGSYAVYYAVWIVFIERACARKLPTLGLFSSLWTSYYLGSLVGQLLAVAFGGYGLAYEVYAMLSIMVVAAYASGTFSSKAKLSREAYDKAEESEFERRVRTLAERHGLSPRESEVLAIWAAGHNAVYIEEALHISRNTIKTHLRHIYQKTGTSSREEILQLLERSES